MQQKESELIFILIGVFLFVLFLGVLVFGKNVQMKNLAVENQWQKVEVLYKQRIDATTEAIGIAKSRMPAEKAIFDEFDSAKKAYESAKNTEGKVKTIGALENAAKKFFSSLNRYPEVTTIDNIKKIVGKNPDLMADISAQVKIFNNLVIELNTMIKDFPKNFVAGMNKINKRSEIPSF